MYPRTRYEMTQADLERILEACKPVPYMIVGGHAPSSPQENANRAWAELGARMGFDSTTVEPISGQGNRFFSAVPSENETQRTERLDREAEQERQRQIATLTAQITELQNKLNRLL
jgi:glucuronate isomerase